MLHKVSRCSKPPAPTSTLRGSGFGSSASTAVVGHATIKNVDITKERRFQIPKSEFWGSILTRILLLFLLVFFGELLCDDDEKANTQPGRVVNKHIVSTTKEADTESFILIDCFLQVRYLLLTKLIMKEDV